MTSEHGRELQGLYTISKIVVFNRRNCCQERLSGFQVDIIGSGGTVFTFNHDPAQGSPGTVIFINVPADIIGDRVKLSLPGKKDYINILEVEVHGDLSAEFNSTNVALNKPTLHSSIYSKDYDSPNAVDGNLESLFHTGNMENNWLRVNLEDLYAIREIIIFNRRNCCQERLRGYQLDIYKSGVPVYTYNHEEPGYSPGLFVFVSIPEGVIGDEVKLSIPGRSDYMNIQQLEVIGEFNAKSPVLTNVALSKPTSQSSLYSNIYPSSNAVNGDKSRSSLFHSGHMLDNWWKVDLQSQYNIKRIVIYNRTDCCELRLRGYQIDIYSDSTLVYTHNHEEPDKNPGEIILIDIPGGVSGDEVKLSLPGRADYINIYEVEVLVDTN